VGSISLIYPYGRDQATYAIVGRAVLNGKTPYKDAWDVKPPGIFYIFALADSLFGRNQTSVRILDIMWQAASAIVVSLAGAIILKNHNLGTLCGVLYLFSYYANNYWNTAQPEGFSTLLLAISLFVVLGVKQGNAWLRFLVVGFLTACAALLKYPLALMLFAPAILLLGKKEPGRRTPFLTLLAGFLVPWAVTILFFHSRSALGDLIYSQFIYGFHHATSSTGDHTFLISLANNVIKMIKILFASRYAIIFLFSVPASILILKEHRKNELVLLFWVCMGFVHVLSQGKLFAYHFLPLLAPMSIMTVICFRSLAESIRSRTSIVIAVLIAIFSIAILRVPFRTYKVAYSDLFGIISGRTSEADYYERLSPRGRKTNFCLPYDLDAARYLRANTDPSDYIFIWGFEPLIYLESGRPSPSRFVYNVPLYCRWARRDFQRELIEKLSVTQPKFIVVAENDSLPAVSGLHIDSHQALERVPDFARLLKEDYTFDRKIGHFTVFTLTSDQEGE